MPPKKSARKTAARPRTSGPESPDVSGFTPSKTAKGFLQERPAIPVKQSFAYGAPGKVTVPRRLTTKTRQKDVVGAIEDIIEGVPEEDPPEEDPPEEDPPEEDPPEEDPPENKPNKGDTTPRPPSEPSSEPPSEPPFEPTLGPPPEPSSESSSEPPSEPPFAPPPIRPTRPPSESPKTPPKRPTSRPVPTYPDGGYKVEGAVGRRAGFSARSILNAFLAMNRELWPRLIEIASLFFWVCVMMSFVLAIIKAVGWTTDKVKSMNMLHDGRVWSTDQYPTDQYHKLKDTFTHEHTGIKSRMESQYEDLSYRITSQHDDLKGRIATQCDSLKDRVASVERDLSTVYSRPMPNLKVNFFALGTGVLVDPYLTSPTKQLTGRAWSTWILGWFMGVPQIRPRPPMAAFTAWDDIGDCWCAPEAGGRSQLTVLLPKKVIPTELVVEHIPMEATLDPGATPKDIELWVQIPDAQTREQVANAAFTHLHRDEDEDGSPNTTSNFSTQRALDKTWVRVGRWQYNIYTATNIQTFEVPVPLEHYDAAVKKVAVRTLSSWGDSEYVCLYRLKLHGILSNTSSMYSTVPP